MTNSYPAPCAVCGKEVPAEGGVMKPKRRGWLVYHRECKEKADADV